jgi:hypothetical protein
LANLDEHLEEFLGYKGLSKLTESQRRARANRAARSPTSFFPGMVRGRLDDGSIPTRRPDCYRERVRFMIQIPEEKAKPIEENLQKRRRTPWLGKRQELSCLVAQPLLDPPNN